MIFTFSFDDAYKSFLSAASILEKYGFRGTFNISLRDVICERRDDRLRMFPDTDILTWGEVKHLQDRGHEIASHGVRHGDLGLATPDELLIEIVGSKRMFNARGINVSTYACAFNSFTPKAERQSEGYYRSIRGVQGINELPMKGRVYHSVVGPEIVPKLPKMMKDNVWVVGAWHDISPRGFEDSVKAVKALKVPVRLVREMM